MSQILEPNETQRILNSLGRPEQNLESAGKPGTGVRGDIAQILSILLTGAGGIRPGGRFAGPTQIMGSARNIPELANIPANNVTRGRDLNATNRTFIRENTFEPDIELARPPGLQETLLTPANRTPNQGMNQAIIEMLRNQGRRQNNLENHPFQIFRNDNLPPRRGGPEHGHSYLNAPSETGSRRNFSTSDITDWLNRANLPHRVETRGQHGTTYVTIPEINPNTGRTENVHIRIPSDGHIGRPERLHTAHNRFDTGDVPPTHANFANPRGSSVEVTANSGGGRYTDLNNIIDALRWRFSRDPDGQFLVPPNQAPIRRTEPGVSYTPPLERPDPNQLRLLSMLGLATTGATGFLDNLGN